MSPPSKPATTARPSTASNSNSVGVHSVGIGALRETERYCCCTTLFSDSQPRCTPQFEKSGLGRRIGGPPQLHPLLRRGDLIPRQAVGKRVAARPRIGLAR